MSANWASDITLVCRAAYHPSACTVRDEAREGDGIRAKSGSG